MMISSGSVSALIFDDSKLFLLSPSMKSLLFVCTENNNRSQMAQAFAILYGHHEVKAYSAGSHPSGKINPKAIAAWIAYGYDHTTHEIKSNILHSSLTNDHIRMMGSDMIGLSLKQGNGIGLCLQCGSEQEINSFLNSLAVGGNIRMGLHQTFWGATYVELTD